MTRRSSRASGRQQEAGARRAHPGLPVGEIVAAAARAGWRDRWRTLAVAVAVSTVTALLQIVAASEIETIVPHPRDAGEILAALAIRGLGEALAEAAIGLTLVELCYRLIALDRTAGPTPAGDRRPSANSRADHLHGRPRARDRGPAG